MYLAKTVGNALIVYGEKIKGVHLQWGQMGLRGTTISLFTRAIDVFV